MQRDVATGLAAGDGADVQEECAAVPGGVVAVVADQCRRGRFDVGQRCAGPRAHRDLDVVAGLQVGDRDDVGNARRPAEKLGPGAGRETLVLALADQGLERGVVAALDLQLDGIRPGGEQFAAELIEPALAAARCAGDDDGAGECRECDGADQTVLHGRFLLSAASGRPDLPPGAPSDGCARVRLRQNRCEPDSAQPNQIREARLACAFRTRESGSLARIRFRVAYQGGGLCTHRPPTMVATTCASRSSQGSRSSTTRSA